MNEIYVCHPEKRDRKTKVLSVWLLVLGVLCFYFANQIPYARMIGQFLSFLFFLGFIYISSKFLLTQYTYTFENGSLFFSSTTGKKIKNLGSLPLTESCLFFSEAEWKARKKDFSIKQKLFLCQNLSPKEAYYLLANTEAGYVLIRFEPDQTLKTRIEGSLLKKKNGEGEY